MDWSKWLKVADKLKDKAPLISGLLNFVPGAQPVAAVISMVSGALGTKEDPDEVMQALESNPEALAKILELQEVNRPKLEEIAMQREANRLAHDTNRINKSAGIIKEEVKSDGIKSTWRPITMLTFVAIIAFNYLVVPVLNIVLTNDIVPVPPPQDLWDLIKIGMGGYVVGRSVEKGIETWKKN